MRPLLSLFLLLLASGCSTGVDARRLVDMQIIDRAGGGPLATYHHGGKSYVPGNPGARYAIRLINRTNERVLAVLSVDGVNVVSGETASPDQRGYVLAPHQTTEVTGWRKSDSEVAQFFFTALANSYAARTGRADNVGVIGLATFREKVQAPPPVSIQSSPWQEDRAERAAAAPADTMREEALAKSGVAQPRSRIGTGHGAREWAPVTHVEFERRTDTPEQLLALFYDSRANLLARGIIPQPRYYGEPRPFPGGYVPDPS